MGLGWEIIICPNSQCLDYEISASLYKMQHGKSVAKKCDDPIQKWNLRPHSRLQNFAGHVPVEILQNYHEACNVLNFSSNAAAALARRCLQKAIHDSWKIERENLLEEINCLFGVVDDFTRNALSSLMSLERIKNLMRIDANMITDVDAKDAVLLIRLVEILLKNWYVDRREISLYVESII